MNVQPRELRYPIGTSGQSLVIDAPVLAHFERHRQARWWHREAGGQLFARLEQAVVTVVEATGPRRGDRRTRHSYEPDRRLEQVEIDDRHRRGLHFVGDWRTHPEPVPRPSDIDLQSISDGFARSTHALNGFLLVIVGTAPLPGGLYTAVSNRVAIYPLSFEVECSHVRRREIRHR